MADRTKGNRRISRRGFIGAAAGGLALGLGGDYWRWRIWEGGWTAQVFVGRAADYRLDLADVITRGLAELGVTESTVRNTTVLLKPNLVEPHRDTPHINTHPLLIRGAIEAFLGLGAARVTVGEGAGHRRDSLRVLDESGVGEILRSDGIRFVDLNQDAVRELENLGGVTDLGPLTFPATVLEADWVVSMPKLKTHHWAGVTLSMKNLFGVMPGIVYGWPKNVLHWAGIEKSIFDITATLRPQLAIADGIVGMEGDGPIMGDPHEAGVIVMGTNLAAVDATAARIMGVDPARIPQFQLAQGKIGPIREAHIEQRGERIAAVRSPFALIESIPAHQGLGSY